jgi:hypothetical protein
MKGYARFIGMLNESRMVAWDVAEFLHSHGFSGVRLLPATTTPNDVDRFDHADSGDIEITKRIEVKQWPNLDFQSLDDVPYRDVIIDEAYKARRIPRRQLYGYFIVNASRTACLFFGSRTMDHWFDRATEDGIEKEQRTFTWCPKEFAMFFRLREAPAQVGIGA